MSKLGMLVWRKVFESLCGSMIKKDGSCPMCDVPTFMSGNGRTGNQKLHWR